jgi:colanic acid/amylovoran biosynthesis glycosyltransferase
METDTDIRVAYVMTHYPRVATTFISGELAEVVALGGHVVPIAMNPPGADDVPTDESRRQRDRTIYLKSSGAWRLALALVRAIRANPAGMARLAGTVIRSARLDLGLIARRVVHLAYGAFIVEQLRDTEVRHLHAHFGLAPATIAWCAAEIGTLEDDRWTWSFTIHGFQDFVNETDARLDLKAASASFVVCVSDFTRSQLCRVSDPRHWDRFHVVRCGIDLDEFAQRAPRPVPPCPRLAVVARLSPEKGHVVLLDALARLRERGIDARLEIIGSGPHEAAIRAEVDRLELAGGVELAGELLPQDVLQHLLDADIFCLPSFSEGLPVSIMEAMAVGIPVVSTAISGIPELAVHDETALTVPPSNVDALVRAIERLVHEPDLGEALSTEARSAVERDHDVHRNVRELVALFDGVM